MSDIKKTALIILIITLLSSSFINSAYAATDIDHDAIMEYDGYAEAMYETIVEQSTFITGHYTENQEYVKESIQEIKDYADFWSNERQGLEDACGGWDLGSLDCLGTVAEKGGAYFLTVGDWFKDMFSDYDDGNSEIIPDNDFIGQVFWKSGTYLIVNNGWRVNASYQGYYIELLAGNSLTWNKGSRDDYYQISLGSLSVRQEVNSSNENINNISKTTMAGILQGLTMLGVKLEFYQNDVQQKPQDTTSSLGRIRDYVNNNPVQIPLPQVKPQLVCPDGTKISMNISGSTFLAVDGTVMLVNKDGTAEINGEICNLNWQKPTVDYNENGEPVVTNPDGTKTNLNTGDTTQKPPGATDLEGCDGVLCGIGKLLDGVGSIVKAISDLVAKLLDGILALFVPDDLGFISTEFTRITDKLTEKIAITETLKDALTGVFDGGGSNPLANISIDLPITNEPLTFGNVSFIEEGVPILRKVISAIVVLYTIVYVYRKITGRGGVMER